MTLATSIASWTGVASREVFIAGRRVEPLSVSVDLGMDTISSTGEVVLPSLPSWVQLRDTMEIRLGWDGQTMTVFTGRVEDIEASFDGGGETTTVKGAGPLKATQNKYWEELVYTGEDDIEIVTDLLDKAGVTERAIEGDGEVLAVVRDIVQPAGSDPWDLINRIDQVLGYKTWDGPDGVVRRRKISGNPAGGAARTFEEGVDIFSVRRPRTLRNVHNAVMVTGLEQEAFTPYSERFAPNPLVPTPPGYIAWEFVSDLIETGDLAEAVSERLMLEVNRVLEEVPLECKGDPRRVPGETVGVVSGRLGIAGTGRFWVRHVTHRFDASGYTTNLMLEGGVGQAGYEIDLPPEAVFTYRLTRETFDVGGTPTTRFTVTADGSASYDPDGVINVWEWENSENADVKTVTRVGSDEPDMSYATAFTEAEIAAGATITLTVTDNDANTGEATQTITTAAKDTLVRDLYIAAGSKAEATPDGGATWNDWTPGAGTVVSTAPIAGENWSLFGLSNGKLFHTDDYLDGTPTEVHDFGSQINCIWLHELNADRVTVGLANGKVFNTTNVSALGSSTWNELADYASAVLDIVESGFVAGQYRVTTGDSLRITYSEFAVEEALITWSGGTARAIVSTMVGLPGVGTASATDPVKAEDGTTYTFVGTDPTDVRAGTHHIRQHILMVVDRAGKAWRTEAGGTEFAHVGTLGGGDPANHMIRDGDNAEVFYVAADDGAWKSYDGGATWGLLRNYSAGGLSGNKIGYGGLRALSVVPVTIVSAAGAEKVLMLWNGASNDAPPAGWYTPGFDDSGWDVSVELTIDISMFYTPPPGADWVTTENANVAASYQFLLRREFAIGAGVVTTASISIGYDDLIRGLWVNNLFIASDLSHEDVQPAGPAFFSIDPAIMLPGETNTLAVWIEQGPTPSSPVATSFLLEVA